MSSTSVLSVLVGLAMSLAVTCVNAKEKRLLLTDQNDIQQELHQIQVKLQDYDVVKAQVALLQTKLSAQESHIELLEYQVTQKGVVYVRWGRKDCGGNGTELVYSGFAGGSYYTHPGAATEYVCLPPDPTWGPHKNIRTYGPALMFGAEYEDTILFGMPDKTTEVPCAVCRSSTHSTSVNLLGLGGGLPW